MFTLSPKGFAHATRTAKLLLQEWTFRSAHFSYSCNPPRPHKANPSTGAPPSSTSHETSHQSL